MKSKLMLFLAGLVALSTASAATIACTPVNNNVISNGVFVALPLAFTCPGTNAGPGNNITAVAVEVFVSFQDAVGGGQHQLTATATEASGEIAGAVASTVTTAVNDNIAFAATTGLGGVTAPGSGATVGITTALAGFTINVNAASLGQVIPDNGSITVAYTTTETPNGSIPEPTSMILLGSGFLAVGLSARLRRKARA
jgi:PEP-CTERM motif